MRRQILSLLFILTLTTPLPAQYLRVSDNQHFLVTEDGRPFFWLADTAWELFHRLDRREVEHYLRNRAGKGFTVIQAVLLSEIDGLTVPNREGHLPLVDLDPTKFNEDYFALVDFAVAKAAEFGLYLALLPTWGAHVEDKWHPLFDNMHIFTEANAYAYGKLLGERYRDRWNVVWILGGDRPADEQLPIWEAMARGLEAGHGGRQLMSYHPMGQQTSATWLHDKSWLDFNMVQTGHLRFSDNVYDWITADYRRTPPKPILNGEPAYEDIPQWFSALNPRYDAYEVRKLAYWSVFAGAFGHTYGNHNIWQMYRPEYTPILDARLPWQEALEQPGAGQMQHLRRLMESRPFLTRIPDQSLLLEEQPSYSSDHLRITRDGAAGQSDASYIMVYMPLHRSFKLNTSVIADPKLFVWWYNPQTGEAFPMGERENTGIFEYSIWSSPIKANQPGPDWVVVIDARGAGYGRPGG